MPQLNEALMDAHVYSCFFILLGCDYLTVLLFTDDAVLQYETVPLLIFTA